MASAGSGGVLLPRSFDDVSALTYGGIVAVAGAIPVSAIVAVVIAAPLFVLLRRRGYRSLGAFLLAGIALSTICTFCWLRAERSSRIFLDWTRISYSLYHSFSQQAPSLPWSSEPSICKWLPQSGRWRTSQKGRKGQWAAGDHRGAGCDEGRSAAAIWYTPVQWRGRASAG